MPSGDNRYYANSQTHHGQMQNNAQGYQQGYWYPQSTTTPIPTSQSQGPTPTYQTSRDDYAYSTSNSDNASYRDRTNYDTSTLSALPSINSALNGEFARTAETAVQGYGFGQTSQTERQPDSAYQQPAYSVSAHNRYGQQQARSNSSNLTPSTSQSAYSVPASRTTQVAQTTPTYQTQPQTQRQNTTISTHSQTSSQWAPLNQQQRQTGADTSASVTRPSEYIARAAASVSTATVPTNRQATTYTSTASTRADPPAPVTVDPHAVYDPYQEYQRQKKRREQEEAEKKRLTEVAEAAKEAERQKMQAAEEAARANDRTATATPEVTIVEAPKKKARQRKSEGAVGGAPKPRKPRKSAPVASTAAAEVDEPAQEAAMTLLATANATTGTTLEEQMREMFKKMREFNSKDPDMLARMWQQERDEYLAKGGDPKGSHDGTSGPPTTQLTKKTTPAKSKAASKATNLGATTTTPVVPAPAPPVAATSTAASKLAAQVPSASLQAATAAKPTMWPADKKQSLANEAAKLLTSDSANAGKVITGAQIGTILDTNPSYIELCQKLESLGFRVDRGSFARALLKAVPDVNKSAQRPLTATGQAPSSISGVVHTSVTANAQLPVSTSAGLTNAANRLLSGGAVIETPSAQKPSPKTKTPRSRKDGGKRKSTGVVTHVIIDDDDTAVGSIDPELEGLDAVKRFIDGQWQDVVQTSAAPTAVVTSGSPTTAKSKSRPARPPRSPLPPAPATKEEVARKRTFADLVDLTAAVDSDDEPMMAYYPDAKRQETEYAAAPTQLMTPPQTEAEQLPAHAAPLVAPVAPMAPTASDIPTLPAIPHGPRLTFLPKPTPPAPPPPRIALDHPSRTTLMVQQIDKYKAIRRSEYNPKTIARDVLLACGRHPDMRHLNAHLEVLKAAFPSIDNSADLGTFRWDIADPGGPAPGSGAEAPTGYDAFDVSDDADDEDESDREVAPVRVAIGVDGGAEVESRTGPIIAAARKSIMPKERKTRQTVGVRTHAGDSSSRPPKPAESSSHHVTQSGGGYAAIRAQTGQQYDEFGNPVKRRGRPVGWRKWMQKDDGGGTPGSGGTPAPKSKTPAKPPTPEPVYQVYPCGWKDCGAELHNLTTLRKHIFKLHGKPAPNKLYPCHWNDCAKVRSIMEGGRTVSRIVGEELTDRAAWQEHVENKHIRPIAWELGDGPAGGLSERESDANSEAYLSDARGRRVTPQIVVPSPAAASGVEGSGGGEHGRVVTAAEREARELQRIAEKRKRDMGVGIDKGGATLANDKRRRGFVDDDEEETVVTPEE